ncbi:MAG: hypothetical protein J6M30_07795 [Bacteroidales bacterium]|nr:hypothetical protein [Bacteroidales bacterium]
MKRKILMLCAFTGMMLTFNVNYAQDFVKQELHLLSKDNPTGERMVIRQGETKKLRGYITVVNGNNPGVDYSKAKYAVKDADYLFEKLSNDIDKVIAAEKKDAVASSVDTLYVVADSLIIEKAATDGEDGYVTNLKGIFLFSEGQKYHQISSSYSNDLEDAIDGLGYALKKRLNAKSETAVNDIKCEPKKRIMSSGWIFGYGYLNWSNDGFFSTPDGSDAYSLKWSDKWDIMYRFTFFPDNAVSLTTGIGIQSNVFRFEDGFDIYPYTVNTPASGYSKDKCKLVARYITVPLIADFHVAKHFSIHAGVIGGINYRNSHTGFKRNYRINGEKTEQSTGSSFKEFNAFKADAMIGIKLYGLTFYASHSLTDMFKDSYGKEMQPFAFGVMLGLK